MRPLLFAVLISACAGPSIEEGDDAGIHDAGVVDAGPRQCSADGSSCWSPETYCEEMPCTYTFGNTGSRCGSMSIGVSCFCARRATGEYYPQCTGGCVTGEDGGFERICLKPSCGNVSCGTGTTCMAYGRCE